MGKINYIIRREEPEDYFKVESLTREAFWNLNCPGCDEHYLAHLIRKSPLFIPELDLIADSSGEIAGNIMYTRAVVSGNKEYEVITFGPLSVLPPYQKMGIGAALVRQSLITAAGMGFKAVFIYGNPAYYSRFGFVDAAKFNVTTRDGDNFPEFMALELKSGGLNGISGKFLEFEGLDFISGLEVFEQQFPYKEKLVLPGQWRKL